MLDSGARAQAMRGMGIGGYARSLGAKITGVEMGGRSPDEEKWAQRIATGLRRALAVCAVLKPDPATLPPSPALPLKPSLVLRPSRPPASPSG